MSGLQAWTTPPEFWEQEWAVCILTTSPWHETGFMSPTEESQVGSATKISFCSAPSPFHSIRRMTVPWLGSGESNLKSGLGSLSHLNLAGRASVSITAWVHGIFMVSVMACSSPPQLHLLPCPTPIFMKTSQPDILTSSNRRKHSMSSCHLTALIPLFQSFEGQSQCHSNNHLAVVFPVYQYS